MPELVTMSTTTIFDKVAARELTPEEGARLLTDTKRSFPQRPAWMPKWAYVPLVVVAYVVFAPVLSNRDQR